MGKLRENSVRSRPSVCHKSYTTNTQLQLCSGPLHELDRLGSRCLPLAAAQCYSRGCATLNSSSRHMMVVCSLFTVMKQSRCSWVRRPASHFKADWAFPSVARASRLAPKTIASTLVWRIHKAQNTPQLATQPQNTIACPHRHQHQWRLRL